MEVGNETDYSVPNKTIHPKDSTRHHCLWRAFGAQEVTISFDIAGIPFAQPRPRITIKNGRAWAYHAHKVETWKETVQLITISELGSISRPARDRLIHCPVALTVIFRLPRPKSLPKKAVYHLKRPDIDNLCKSTVDAMTRAGAWKDDSQIFLLSATKLYALPGEEGATVMIEYKDTNEIGGLVL